MAKKYTVIIEKDEDGWLISEVVGLPGCHTQAKSLDQLLERTKEAIKAYLGPISP
ncbi:MAG: type II toxin-antitoxin system HicB family antitoxin [Candidatus Woesearchaeota archaeon]|nr:type II toxin-antitoxin system HicB family antitoxin [Candidatus Woesearchaeota archaeon]